MRKNIIDNLVQCNKELQEKVKALEERVNHLEISGECTNQYGRRNNVEIAGIPNDVDEGELEDKIIDIYNELDIKIKKRNIEACHRLPASRNKPYAKKNL